MSASAFKSQLNKINNGIQKINIICKNQFGEIIYVEQISFKDNYQTLKDIENYIKKLYCNKDELSLLSFYDKETQKNIIFHNAEKNDFIINWDKEMFNWNIPDVFAKTNTQAITIILIESPGGLGSASGGVLQYIGTIIEIIKIVLRLLCYIIQFVKSKFFPYQTLQKHIKFDKDFVIDVIYKSKQWPVGFLCTTKIPFKTSIEKSIMKGLGYKKMQKNWILVNRRILKYPQELT